MSENKNVIVEGSLSVNKFKPFNFEPIKYAEIKLDWDKVKTIEDIKLILQEIYPNTMLGVPPERAHKFDHLKKDEPTE